MGHIIGDVLNRALHLPRLERRRPPHNQSTLFPLPAVQTRIAEISCRTENNSGRHKWRHFGILSEFEANISNALLLRGNSTGEIMELLSRAIAAALFAAVVITPAAGQERTATKGGFSLTPQSGKTILVFRPTVRVGGQSTGGLFEPNADWTDKARENIDAALAKRQGTLGNRVVTAPVSYGEEAQLVEEYSALFAAVSQSVIQYQFFVGNRLPTKKRDNKADVFEWSLGSGVAALPGAKDADYALFIWNKDAYGSTGRKLLQVAAAFGGVSVTSGEHKGYAGLIDLKTGDLMWLNADAAMGGDVREVDGAEKRVAQLLEEFPGSMPQKLASTQP